MLHFILLVYLIVGIPELTYLLLSNHFNAKELILLYLITPIMTLVLLALFIFQLITKLLDFCDEKLKKNRP